MSFDQALAELRQAALELRTGLITMDAWHLRARDVLTAFEQRPRPTAVEPAAPAAPADSAPTDPAQKVAA